jgi:exodeoxyribonuclease VII large subunit
MPKIPLTIRIPEETVATKDALFSSNDLEQLAQPLKVCELVAMLKNDVEKRHRFVRVIGEISSFKLWRSGHGYFDIKDEQALLPAVMFKQHCARLDFAMSDGLSAIFTGHISIYKANARLQMIVESIEPIGQGALALAFDQLKEKLKAEGLFDAKAKKPIKMLNRCVGLITSSHGAVLRDMVRILKSRMPLVDILFSPVRVQGQGAAEEIKQAIELLDQTQGCDVIIVGRGGGSLEDLMAFNSEMVARAIFKAKTPIISAVGHETDVTISDFVADLRAATPTHAASIVVPVYQDVMADLAATLKRLKLLQHKNLRHSFLLVTEAKRRIKDPKLLLLGHWQNLEQRRDRLHDAINKKFSTLAKIFLSQKHKLYQLAPNRTLRLKNEMLQKNKQALIKLCPTIAMAKARANLVSAAKTLHNVFARGYVLKNQELKYSALKLDALSPLKVLGRGYSIVHSEDKSQVLSKTNHFYIDQAIIIRVEDGAIKALVTNKEL